MAGEAPKTMDAKCRVMKERIDLFEKQLLDIGNSIALLARREAKTRDVGDTLASQMMTFAEADKLLPTFKRGLYIFADYFAAIQDYRNALVDRMEARVVQEVAYYEDYCKKAREELNIYTSNWRNFGRRNTFPKEEGIEEVPGMPGILGYIDRFEQKRLFDLKKLFTEMAQIELIFHCKAMEMLTNGFKGLASIDTEQDIQEFRKFFSVVEGQGVTPSQTPDVSRNQPLPPIKKSPSHSELDNQKPPETQSSSLLRRFNSTPSVLTDDKRNNRAETQRNQEEEEEDDESDVDDEEAQGSEGNESDESDIPPNEQSSTSTGKSSRPTSARR